MHEESNFIAHLCANHVDGRLCVVGRGGGEKDEVFGGGVVRPSLERMGHEEAEVPREALLDLLKALVEQCTGGHLRRLVDQPRKLLPG